MIVSVLICPCVSAVDANQTDLKAEVHDIMEDEALTDENADFGNFTDLNELISHSDNELKLDKNYKFNSSQDKDFDGFTISKDNYVIDGQGYTIDGSGQVKIFIFTGSNITLKNVNIMNAKGTDGPAAHFTSLRSIDNCSFINNSASGSGGAVYISNSISNCKIDSVFINNSAKNGGAIYFNGETTNITVNGYYENNAAERGAGAIYVKGKSSNSTFASDFYHNYAGVSGGAIFFYNLVENNQFESIFRYNNGSYGAGIFFYNKANNNRFNSNFTFNVAKSCGGGMFFYNTTNNNNFTGYFINNSALGKIDIYNGNGGGITFKDTSSNNIFTCDFINNTAVLNGGGVNYRKTPHNITFNGNFINNTAKYGGGANFIDNMDNVIFNGEFTGNSAVYGGAIGVKDGVIENVTFKNNHAKYGGAINFYGKGTVNNSNFTNNSANDGGAISAHGNLTVTNSEFADNVAAFGTNQISLKENAAITLINVTPSNLEPFHVGLIIPENITPDETSQVSLVLDEDATGNVTMYVGGKEYLAEIKDSIATAIIGGLPAGRHTIVAVYSGDETHEAETVIGTVEVTKIKPSLVIEGDFDNLTAGDNLTFIIIMPDDATGYILADFDGYHSFKEIEDGKVTVRIFDLKTGEKNITVKYIGDDKYEESDNFTSFNVGKNQEYGMNISTEGDSYKTVVDVALPDDATGEVTVSDDKGNNYTAPVKDGEVNVYDLPVGENNLTVTYSGDEKYASKTENKTVNAPKAGGIAAVLTADKFAMISGDGSKFTAVLTDANGRPLSGKALKLTIVGKTYTAITNDDGVAQWPIGLKPGIYPASVIFNGDADYNASNNASTSAEILSSLRLDQNRDLVKDYHDDAKAFTVRALDKFGKPLGVGQYVKISVSTKTYTLKTDSKGIATLPINLYPGTYKITSEFAGCKVSNIITVKEVLSAYNRQYARASSYKFSATLKHSDGNAMSNQKLTFTINGKTYTAVTNAKGEATVIINQALKAGKYTIQVKYIQHFITKSITIK